jgi:DNA-binding transcriptional MerR regulator
MAPEARYGVEELAGLAGVSRRTVRYYVQEGLLPPPFGLGRGRHYGPPHLETLVRLKTLQEQGLTLAAIRERLARTDARVADSRPAAAPPRSAWTRLEVLPGIELNVSSAWRLPPPGRLRELAAWCRQNFPPEEETDA